MTTLVGITEPAGLRIIYIFSEPMSVGRSSLARLQQA